MRDVFLSWPFLSTLFLDFPFRIPSDFPEVSVQILEVSGVPPQKHLLLLVYRNSSLYDR